MAQQDKTDWYWNGVLAGAVNNLYYDFINVDVVHTPYSSNYRNSSFFLQTRMNYASSNKWTVSNYTWHRDWDVVDLKYIWEDNCSRDAGTVYALLADKWRSKIRIHSAKISDWCVWEFDWARERWHIYTTYWCWAFKLFVTNYVKWKAMEPADIKDETWIWTPEKCCDPHHCEESYVCWIQINKYEGWTTHWYFSDTNVENGTEKFIWRWEDEENPERGYAIWQYILVYKSRWNDDDGFAGQVRMITWKEWDRLTVDAPWQGFKTLSWEEDEEDEVQGGWLWYKIFDDWWEVIGFTNGKRIFIMTDPSDKPTEVYDQTWLVSTNIISVVEATDKIFVLTENGYIHYSNYNWYDKFFVQDDVYAWSDKTSLASYRDLVIAFGNKHIAVWVPDENNMYTTMYNQTNTVWLWSRYSYAEYDWDLLFVSNDKRLLALTIANNTWKYMLQYEDVWDALNGKLSTLIPSDEVFIWNDNNDLRVFLRTKSMPYYNDDWDWQANLAETPPHKHLNTMTRIFKFNKQFKVWTEDWVQWLLLQWVERWMYYWENWLYQRGRWDADWRWDVDNTHYAFKSYISAYLMENESDWVGWTNSWLANRPKLYNLSKLNRLITTLWPGEYSHSTKLRITSYVKWLWSVYEFSVDGWNNDWLWLITTKYLWETPDPTEQKKLECMNSVIQDSQKAYQPKCVGRPNAAVQNLAQQHPWCEIYSELLTLDRWICIDDSLYELAPTMPLVTELWENQNYATQIKLELIWWVGDIISFGGWLWEMFVAPLFSKGPDWEYHLQPNSDC